MSNRLGLQTEPRAVASASHLLSFAFIPVTMWWVHTVKPVEKLR